MKLATKKNVKDKPLDSSLLEPLVESNISLQRNGNREWYSLTDAELVRYAQAFVRKDGIVEKTGLRRLDEGLYRVLLRRKLFTSIGFRQQSEKEATGATKLSDSGKTKRRKSHGFYSKMNDLAFVDYIIRFLKERSITSKGELEKADIGLYVTLLVRERESPGIMNRVGFSVRRRDWNSMNNEDLLYYTRRFMSEGAITSKSGLESVDMGLYRALVRRERKTSGFLGRIGFNENLRNWNSMNDDEFVQYIKGFMMENSVTTRSELRQADIGMYCALIRRDKKSPGVVRKIGFVDKIMNWKSMSDTEIESYALGFLKEKSIKERKDLSKSCPGLYRALLDRGILDCVFSEIEFSRTPENGTLSGLSQAALAMEKFGGEGE